MIGDNREDHAQKGHADEEGLPFRGDESPRNPSPRGEGAWFTSVIGPGSRLAIAGSKSLVYRVIYDFGGFSSPVDNPDVFNKAKASSSIPVKFSLGDDKGLDVLASGSPSSQSIGCDSSDPIDVIEQTVTAGASTLTLRCHHRPVHLRMEDR